MQRISGHNTEQLLTLAREGDESALDRLCRIYSERVRWMIRLRMGGELRSKLESMDVVQDALIHALGGLESFTYTNEGDFVRWLSKIVEHTLCEHWDRLHADKRNIRKEVRLRSLRSTTGSSARSAPRVMRQRAGRRHVSSTTVSRLTTEAAERQTAWCVIRPTM